MGRAGRTQLGRGLAVFLLLALLPAYDCTPSPAGDDPEPAPTPGDNHTPAPAESPADAVDTRFPRLTHRQWANSARDLFFLPADVDLAATLRPDPSTGGSLFTDYGRLRVDDTLFIDYQQVAEDVSRLVTEDAALLETLAPTSAQTMSARIDAFLATHGPRAHRRPLDDEMTAAYRGLFDEGVERGRADGANDLFVAGLRPVIEALLLSPHFIYRPEVALPLAADQPLPLDDHEMASRLSFALWDTMPDDKLFAAAAAGTLSTADEVAAAARDMLEDQRAIPMINRFFHRLFEVDRYTRVAPPEDFGLSTDFGEALATEHRLFVERIVRDGGGLTELLTSHRTYVNAELAALYGLDGEFDNDFDGVDLDPSQRRGILSTLGFLAKNAAGYAPDPIHRGVFIATRLACHNVPPPPDDLPPIPVAEGETNRELVEGLTEQEGSSCAGCHATLINPFGFPFEQYDAVGRYREEDNGQPIDTESLVLLGSETTSVSGPLQLADALAASPDVHRCHARWWLSTLFGRNTIPPRDQALLDALGTLSLDDAASVKELIVALVSSESFRTRAPEVTP